MKRPDKDQCAEDQIATCVATNRVSLSKHAVQRMNERGISFSEIIAVLRSGRRERAKDAWRPGLNRWCYAYRTCVDERDLRVAVALDEAMTIVVTAIDLDLE